MRFGGPASRLVCAFDFAIISVPNRLRRPPLTGDDRQGNSRRDAEARLLITNGIHPPFRRNCWGVARNLSPPKNDSRPASSRSGGKSSDSDEPSRSLFAFLDRLC